MSNNGEDTAALEDRVLRRLCEAVDQQLDEAVEAQNAAVEVALNKYAADTAKQLNEWGKQVLTALSDALTDHLKGVVLPDLYKQVNQAIAAGQAEALETVKALVRTHLPTRRGKVVRKVVYSESTGRPERIEESEE
jgi:hypothetical protein